MPGWICGEGTSQSSQISQEAWTIVKVALCSRNHMYIYIYVCVNIYIYIYVCMLSLLFLFYMITILASISIIVVIVIIISDAACFKYQAYITSINFRLFHRCAARIKG